MHPLHPLPPPGKDYYKKNFKKSSKIKRNILVNKKIVAERFISS